MGITYCQMTQNSLKDTAKCLDKVLPYVDRAIIIDGGSLDDTLIYLRNRAKQTPKLEVYLVPWKDHFSNQRNEYLSRVKDGDIALVSDPDELFSEEALQLLPALVKKLDTTSTTIIGFRCRSISLRGEEKVWESLDNYYKGLMFRKTPTTRYEGNPHEHIGGMRHEMYRTESVYEHIKQENVIWPRGLRNMFCGGGGPNGHHSMIHEWRRLREIAKKLGLETWHQFNHYLMKGNIDQELKDWMIQHKLDDFGDGASEFREAYKTYFRLYHPEEESAEFKAIHIP